MVLWGELLGAELVDGDDFDGEGARVHEAAGVEGDLADQAVVGHHHGHGAEEYLQVVGQLGAAGVSGIHCDAHVALGVEWELCALEVESGHFVLDGADDAQDLLGHDGQHL